MHTSKPAKAQGDRQTERMREIERTKEETT